MNTTDVLLPQTQEFSNLPKKYKETYAAGIQNFFVDKRYDDKERIYRREYDFEKYTGLIEDLMGTNAKSLCKSKDVYGFSITSIEKAFFQNKDFSSLKSYLMKNNPSGKNGVKYTSNAMDGLFKCLGLK